MYEQLKQEAIDLLNQPNEVKEQLRSYPVPEAAKSSVDFLKTVEGLKDSEELKKGIRESTVKLMQNLLMNQYNFNKKISNLNDDINDKISQACADAGDVSIQRMVSSSNSLGIVAKTFSSFF